MIHIADPNSRGKYRNGKTGVYNMMHPEKFTGTEKPVYKSNLEFLFMRYADTNPAIVQWGYENCSIKYLDKSTNPAKVRRYFIDFVCKVRVGSLFKTVWVEIKPKSETHKPRSNANVKTQLIWVKNQCKWEAATQLAKLKGYEFHVITEEELN